MSDDVSTLKAVIAKALEVAKDGQIDGDHHKLWVIDQMVRVLTGCPIFEKVAKDCNGKTYLSYKRVENDAYTSWVKEVCAGKDGPDTYEWDVGIAP
jgi:hypothetical protein